MANVDPSNTDQTPIGPQFSNDVSGVHVVGRPGYRIAFRPYNTGGASRAIRRQIGGEIIPFLVSRESAPALANKHGYLAVLALVFMVVVIAGVFTHFVFSGPIPMLAAALGLLGVAVTALLAKRITTSSGNVA